MALNSEVVMAMDWGGTWIRASAIDRQGQILWQDRVANVPDSTKEQMLNVAEDGLRRGCSWCDAQGYAIVGIGVAAAGPVDTETGTLHDPPNLPLMNGVSLKSLWEPVFGYPVFVGNDANLAAMGEFHYGAGLAAQQRGNPPRTLVYITVSTGIGGGVVDRGRAFMGAHGLACEIGHMIIDFRSDGPACACGGSGCLESLASGTAISRIARDRLKNGDGVVSTLRNKLPEPLTSEMVFGAASHGDAFSKSIIDGVVVSLSVGVTSVLHVYNPDLIVLGGGVTEGLKQLELLPRIQGLAVERAMSRRHGAFALVASFLGDAVGMVGAASLVWEECGA